MGDQRKNGKMKWQLGLCSGISVLLKVWVPFCGPNRWEHSSILGSMLGSPYLRKLPKCYRSILNNKGGTFLHSLCRMRAWDSKHVFIAQPWCLNPIWVVVKMMVPFWGTLNIRCRVIIGIQKETIILTTTHMGISQN